MHNHKNRLLFWADNLKIVQCPSRRLFALLLLHAILFSTSPAQKINGALLRGSIRDEETGAPIESAIAFLEHTSLGTSSGTDGTFRIAHIPAGAYELVVARVGYQRKTVALDLTHSDSLFVEIALQPEAVRAGEVEISGQRATDTASLQPSQLIISPNEDPGTYRLYGGGVSLPVGAFFTDSALYLYALDTAICEGEKYISLWLLYKNLSGTPKDLDPMTCVQLDVVGKERSYTALPPAPPSVVREVLTKEDAVRKAHERIGKTFELLLRFQEQIKPGTVRVMNNAPVDAGGGTTADLSGTMQFRLDPVKNPALVGTSTEYLAGIYRESVHSGILQRNSIYPGNAIDGFVYFPFPGMNWHAGGAGFPEAGAFTYRIEIIASTGSKIIEFTPN